MSKFHITFLFLIIFISTNSFGQTYTFNPPPTTYKSKNKPKKPGQQDLIPVLSSDEFQKKVKEASEQNQKSLNKETNKSLVKLPPPTSTNKSESSLPATTTSPMTTGVSQPPPPASPTIAPAMPRPSQIETTTTPTQTTTVPPQQNQIYTGFGSGQQPIGGTGTSPSSSQPKQPLNIKY